MAKCWIVSGSSTGRRRAAIHSDSQRFDAGKKDAEKEETLVGQRPSQNQQRRSKEEKNMHVDIGVVAYQREDESERLCGVFVCIMPGGLDPPDAHCQIR